MPTPPLCIGCQVQPVKPAHGVTHPGSRGLRYVDGYRWRWFCSTRCSARNRAGGFDTAKATRARMIAAEQRVARRLIAAVKEHLDPDGRVDPRDLVRAMMRELRGQYQRTYHRRRREERAA